MRCPNCEHELGSGTVCPVCGADAYIISKTCAVSDTLYNKGLQKVRVRDLSGAVESLTKSIEFNRKNIEARNLLGLVYFEMGELGEALRHWVISTYHLKENNPASGYIERIQERSRELERYNDAIKMYNQALSYVEQKSEDLAIIQLRKAVDINPRFIQAMNLLAFCHLIQKDKEKARALLDKVLAIDTNNAIALNYLMELGVQRQRMEAIQKSSPRQTVTMTQATGGYTRLTTKDKKSFGSTFHIAEIIFFVIGVLCSLALFYIIIIPSALETRDSTIDRLKNEIAASSQSFESSKTTYDEEIAGLREELSSAVKSNEQLNENIALLERIRQAYAIINLYNSGSVEEAAEAVYSFDTTGLPADVLENLLTVKDEAYKQTASANYTAGVQDYQARRYAEAKLKFGKALKFADPEATQTPESMYFLALIAEYDGETDEAVKYYQSIVSNYPDSTRYNRSIEGLGRLTE